MSAFSIFTDRKKKKKNTKTPTVEQYYQRSARRISHARYTCLLLTVLLVVYGFSVHGDELTADNFRYMLKFLDLTEDTADTADAALRFDYAESNKGGLYKGDLVVLNSDGLAVYSRESGTTGDRLYSESFHMEDPKLAITGQSIFAYDLGGSEVRMFNSYSQIARLVMDYPVYGFSASESGHFAVITSEKNYRTAVYVYDSYARQIYKRLLSNTYIDQISLSPDGETFAVLGHESEGGYLVSILQVYSVHEEEPLYTASYQGELPLMVGYLSDGAFAVLTGSRLRFYDGTGETPAATVSMDGKDLQNCTFSDGRVLVTFGESGLAGGTVVTVYAPDGGIAQTVHVDGAPEDIRFSGDTLYILTTGELLLCPQSGETSARKTEGDALQLLFDSDGTVIVFEKSLAYQLD